MILGAIYNALYEAALPVYGEREGRAVCMTIMEDIYGADRTVMALQRDREVDEGSLENIVGQIASGRPVQYITGRADFDGLTLGVGEGVLIPRPETAELVRWIISDIETDTRVNTPAETGADRSGFGPDLTSDQTDAPFRILDLGTGSGAIAISLAKRLQNCRVAACDISEEALVIARRNAERHGTAIGFFRCDILGGPRATGPFQVIVSNPPYIPASEARSMHPNVRDHEPAVALFVPDDDPLLFYRAIGHYAIHALSPGGRLFFEVYEKYAADTARLLQGIGFTDTEIRRDIHGRERMIKSTKPTDGRAT